MPQNSICQAAVIHSRDPKWGREPWAARAPIVNGRHLRASARAMWSKAECARTAIRPNSSPSLRVGNLRRERGLDSGLRIVLASPATRGTVRSSAAVEAYGQHKSTSSENRCQGGNYADERMLRWCLSPPMFRQVPRDRSAAISRFKPDYAQQSESAGEQHPGGRFRSNPSRVEPNQECLRRRIWIGAGSRVDQVP